MHLLGRLVVPVAVFLLGCNGPTSRGFVNTDGGVSSSGYPGGGSFSSLCNTDDNCSSGLVCFRGITISGMCTLECDWDNDCRTAFGDEAICADEGACAVPCEQLGGCPARDLRCTGLGYCVPGDWATGLKEQPHTLYDACVDTSRLGNCDEFCYSLGLGCAANCMDPEQPADPLLGDHLATVAYDEPPLDDPTAGETPNCSSSPSMRTENCGFDFDDPMSVGPYNYPAARCCCQDINAFAASTY